MEAVGETLRRDFRCIDTYSRALSVNYITKSTHPTYPGSLPRTFNTVRPGLNGRHFTDNFHFIFCIKIVLNQFVRNFDAKDPIDNKRRLV